MGRPEERNELFERLAEVLGEENAARLMEHLPPSRWDEIATKDDLRLLENRLTARLDTLENRFGTFEAHFDTFETHMEGHLGGVAGKTEGLIAQVATLTGQFDGLQAQFRTFDTRLGGVESGIRDLALSYATQMRTVLLAIISTIFAAVALIGLGVQLVR
ncbi:MAG: hypothetical protein IT198_02210 [Acidimicrobiia bacterium]|nr:hypothetical protein [Acidimicrobiia bacterium]